MKKVLSILIVLTSCGGEQPLVPSLDPNDSVEVVPPAEATPPVVSIPPGNVLVLAEPPFLPEITLVERSDSGVVETDAGATEWPGNSGNNNRCDAGQGKKLGLIKHGKCDP